MLFLDTVLIVLITNYRVLSTVMTIDFSTTLSHTGTTKNAKEKSTCAWTNGMYTDVGVGGACHSTLCVYVCTGTVWRV